MSFRATESGDCRGIRPNCNDRGINVELEERGTPHHAYGSGIVYAAKAIAGQPTEQRISYSRGRIRGFRQETRLRARPQYACEVECGLRSYSPASTQSHGAMVWKMPLCAASPV